MARRVGSAHGWVTLWRYVAAATGVGNGDKEDGDAEDACTLRADVARGVMSRYPLYMTLTKYFLYTTEKRTETQTQREEGAEARAPLGRVAQH